MSFTVSGDLLTYPAHYIVQQCNCVTITSHGLSKAIADKFPYADVYKKRQHKQRKPGTVDYSFSNNDKDPIVVSIFGQISPGVASNDTSNRRKWQIEYKIDPLLDTNEKRVDYFQEGLNKFKEHLTSIQLINKTKLVVTFPKNIGCGLAGGDWNQYLKMITEFKNKVKTLNIAFPLGVKGQQSDVEVLIIEKK